MVSQSSTPVLDLEDSGDSNDLTGGDVQCVFSSQEMLKVGTGTTTRKHVSKIYWFVQSRGKEEFLARQINSHHVPAGEDVIIGLAELLETYIPEIEIWEEKVLPAMQELETLLEDGTSDREDGKLYSAEESFKQALTIEEQNVRALFNLGLIYLELEATDKARDMMTELLKLKTPFTGKDQHLFNELGISLRKNEMYDEAVAYYAHALQFIKDDEHLFYNLSRAHYERNDWPECVAALKACRELNPQLSAACDLAQLLYELSNDDALCKKNGKPVVPNNVAAAIVSVHNIDRTAYPVQNTGSNPETGRARTSGVVTPDSFEEVDI